MFLILIIVVAVIDASSSDKNYNRRYYASVNSKPHISDEIPRGYADKDEDYSMNDAEYTMYDDGEEEENEGVDRYTSYEEDEWTTMEDWGANVEQGDDGSRDSEEERIVMALARVSEGERQNRQNDVQRGREEEYSFTAQQRPFKPNVSSRSILRNPQPNGRTLPSPRNKVHGNNKKMSLSKRRPSNVFRQPTNRITSPNEDNNETYEMPPTQRAMADHESNAATYETSSFGQQTYNTHGEDTNVSSPPISPYPQGFPQQFHGQYPNGPNNNNYLNPNTVQVASSMHPSTGPWPATAATTTALPDPSMTIYNTQPEMRHTGESNIHQPQQTSSSGLTGASSAAASVQPGRPIPSSSPIPGGSPIVNLQPPSAATAVTGPVATASTTPWIRQYLAARPKDILLPIPLDYLSDGFNLVQLAPIVERIGLETLARAGEDPVEVAKRLQQLQHQIGGTTGASSKAYLHPIYRTALKLILRQEQDARRSNLSGPATVGTPPGMQQPQEGTGQATSSFHHQDQRQQNVHNTNQFSQLGSVDEDPLLALIPAPALERAAEALYLMVHARFVTSPRGLETIRRILITSKSSSTKQQNQQFQHHAVFGRCPRLSCHGMPLLPYGDENDYHSLSSALPSTLLSSSIKQRQQMQRYNYYQHRCKRYCCSCGETFYFWDSKTDGCAWGPNFCHLFLLAYGQQVFPQVVVERQQQEQQNLRARSSTSSPGQDASTNVRDRQSTSSLTSNQCKRQVYGFEIHPSTPWGHQLK